MKLFFLYTIFICCAFFSPLNAQPKDSLNSGKSTKHAIYSNARKAIVMSALMPGLGQVYNKKYWKVPLILGTLGGITYWGINNNKQYKYYSTNLRAENDDDALTINTTNYNSAQLIIQKRYYRKYRDIAIMTGVLVYLINVIDANVDAHLKTFDVSDDLSLRVIPFSQFDVNSKLQTGLTLHLNFK